MGFLVSEFMIFKKKYSILLFYKKKSFNFAPVLS